MADVRGFRGLRYAPQRVGDLSAVVCPPYDVVSPREAAELRAASPYNAIRLELPEPEAGDTAGLSRYRRAAETLAAWRTEGVLARDPEPVLYAIEETFAWEGTTHRRRGVMAAVRLADWEARVVLPHEHTLAGPKADRLELLRACRTNFSPIFMLYPPQPDAEAALWRAAECEAPLAEVRLPDQRQTRVWAVGRDGAALSRALAACPLYIADGHHRYETALRYRDERRAAGSDGPDAGYEFVMTYLVAMDDPGLLVLPTHRVVPAGRVPDAALDALLAERFDAEARPLAAAGGVPGALAELARRGASGTALALYRPGVISFLQPRAEAARYLPAERLPAWRALDVAQLDSLLLRPLLGPEAAEALNYTRDAAEAVAAVDAGEAGFAVLMNATLPTQIAAVADVSERMPQKSTYFYPKLSSGLMFHVLDGAAVV
ncbi:MAG TPA: DUF1015 domain-containing protein [Chloroflexota bacterium]|nr:DUF1015 domain-containing protein [Chloroflexota bacterium]